MNKKHGSQRAFTPIVGNLVLLFVGLTVALGTMELFLRAFPNWLPGDVRVDPPVRRIQALSDQSYDIKLSNGDLFYWMKGRIAPVPSDQDKVVAQVRWQTDADGFRNNVPKSDTYDIVALGDSFTIGGNVASPWPQMLAEYSGSTVLNLGEAGNGPQQELKILRQYGLDSSPQWVILAFFEGNDLHDAASYAQASYFILPRFGKYVMQHGLDAFSEGDSSGDTTSEAPNYRYPITVKVNGNDLQLAFFSYYVAWLSVSRDVIESSQNYALVEETIIEARDLTEAAGAQFLLVYVPSKEHVYLPYLKDPDVLANVFTDVPSMELGEAGFLQFTNKQVSPELASQHSDDQSSLLAAFAAGQNIHYLDLTPVFQEQASSGVELYYPFDTHWNQLGHNLAAGTINQYIHKIPSGLPSISGS
jgi:hypothetical protein